MPRVDRLSTVTTLMGIPKNQEYDENNVAGGYFRI
jgi:hypothetical protein